MAADTNSLPAGASLLTSVFGAIGSGISSYYSSESTKTSLQAQQNSLKYQYAGQQLAFQGQQAILQGQLQGNQIAYNSVADLSAINSQIAEMQAGSARLQGDFQYSQSRLATGQLKGAQTAGMAANGIDLSSPTATAIVAGTDLMGNNDANTIRNNAIYTAFGYRTQAVNATNQALTATANAQATGISSAALSTMSGLGNTPPVPNMAASVNPGMNSASSLLTGAGQVASAWYRYANQTTPKTEEPIF
jgi:hypothetical protein